MLFYRKLLVNMSILLWTWSLFTQASGGSTSSSSQIRSNVNVHESPSPTVLVAGLSPRSSARPLDSARASSLPTTIPFANVKVDELELQPRMRPQHPMSLPPVRVYLNTYYEYTWNLIFCENYFMLFVRFELRFLLGTYWSRCLVKFILLKSLRIVGIVSSHFGA